MQIFFVFNSKYVEPKEVLSTVTTASNDIACIEALRAIEIKVDKGRPQLLTGLDQSGE